MSAVFSSLRKFVSWAFLKLVFGAFILGSSVTIYALWLFEHDDPDFSIVHVRHVSALKEQQAALQAQRDTAARELASLQQEFGSYQECAARAAKIAADLQEMQSWWKRFFGDRQQWQRNARGIERMQQIEAESKLAANKLRRNLTRAAVRLENEDQALARLNAQLQMAEWSDSQIIHYLYESWRAGKWIFIGLVCLYFFGPTLHKLGLFYYFAPRIARSRPLQLTRASAPFPWLGESRSVVETSLWPGETARVRMRYLQSVEEGVVRESRMLLSWRFPFTSMLSGFVHDVNLRNSRAGRDYRLAFAHHKNPENQMAIVHVPEGGSLVVRPSFLAGVILPPGQKLRFRRRWQLFRWQAWLTGQLRFVEFTGPCRLVVAGRPGLRAERLTAREDGAVPSCRTSQDKTIGFTPNLEYRLIRTARFWNYYRWDAMLFDASFSGVGFVLIQTSLPGRTPGIWSATRNRARKLIGL